MLRYLLLHHYGGIYLDLDITCQEPLDNLLHVPFLTSATSTKAVGVNNAFILSRPQHPFLADLITKRAEKHATKWLSPWFEAMISTGYIFLSNAWMDYVQHNPHPQREDAVFVLADENGEYKTHALGGTVDTPLFKHQAANSWHTWDARICIFMEQHLVLSIVFFICLVLLWLSFIIIACCGLPSPKRRQARRARQEEVASFHTMRAEQINEEHEYILDPSGHQSPSDSEAMREFPDDIELPVRPPACHIPAYGRPSSSIQPSRPTSVYDRAGAYDERTSSMMPPLDPPYRGRPWSIA